MVGIPDNKDQTMWRKSVPTPQNLLDLNLSTFHKVADGMAA